MGNTNSISPRSRDPGTIFLSDQSKNLTQPVNVSRDVIKTGPKLKFNQHFDVGNTLVFSCKTNEINEKILAQMNELRAINAPV